MYAALLQAKQKAKPVPAHAFPQHEGSSLVDLIEQVRSLGSGGDAATPDSAERGPEANGDHSAVAEGLEGGLFPSGMLCSVMPMRECRHRVSRS